MVFAFAVGFASAVLGGGGNADGVYESHQFKAAAQAKPEGLLRRFVPCCALRGLCVVHGRAYLSVDILWFI